METSLIYCFSAHPTWVIRFDQISASGSLAGPGIKSVSVDGLALQEMPASGGSTGFVAVVAMPLSKHLSINVVGVHVTSLSDLAKMALSARPPSSSP